MENYYETLHLANFAEIEVVKAAYRAITKLYHPDINKNVDTSVIVKINLAYEILGNPEKKANYDKKLREFLNTSQYNTNRGSKEHASNDVNKNASAKPRNSNNSSENIYSNKPQTKAEKFAKTIGIGLWTAVDAFINSASEFQKETENAYYQGSEFNNTTLVKRYLKSSGAKRNGYLKVLIERRLIYKENGKLIPSYEFKNITRYIKGEGKNGY